MSNKGGTIGGGEILKYWNQNSGNSSANLDTALIKQFLLLPAVKILIIVLLMVIAFLIIIKMLKVRNPLRGKAMTRELEHLDKVKKHDESIIRANKIITTATNLIEKTFLSLNKSNVDYWKYNLERANIRVPGGARVMRPQEFNAIIRLCEMVSSFIGLIIALLLNLPLGVLFIATSLIIASTMPMIILRQKVKEKDIEITENFADFYLMIHYVLLASSNTPISGIMKSYDKTTDSKEMHRFVDTCIHYIDTFGEYEATRYIARQYREIPEVSKLMRLIRQANEGGDIRAELAGFRKELLDAKRYAIEKRMNMLVLKAKASFNILMPILGQAIISAMAIYFDDLSIASTFF